MVQVEQALLEEHRVRVARATESWLTGNTSTFDLRGRLLPDAAAKQAAVPVGLLKKADAELRDSAGALLKAFDALTDCADVVDSATAEEQNDGFFEMLPLAKKDALKLFQTCHFMEHPFLE